MMPSGHINIYPWHGERLTLTEIARRTGINRRTIWTRLEAGWPLERAATMPPVAHSWLASRWRKQA